MPQMEAIMSVSPEVCSEDRLHVSKSHKMLSSNDSKEMHSCPSWDGEYLFFPSVTMLSEGLSETPWPLTLWHSYWAISFGIIWASLCILHIIEGIWISFNEHTWKQKAWVWQTAAGTFGSLPSQAWLCVDDTLWKTWSCCWLNVWTSLIFQC